ncbi:hypothetical protein E0H73_40745 [Kribbella pittospori]|uniref:Uncharacterized protein n=1 Tax=Kribbella pittospori TaxID=722689 RepID=A0A4R0K154_9ACTN|nr:hypothetical protein [Kribbella pittospori]TCC51456.1 hypothetical protein E0H73_40745 [Kribbella pittospori]
MTYTPQKPPIAETSDQLRARIPGWGADLDPNDRPAVPKEKYDPHPYGAVWDFPDRQVEEWPRERSNEHEFLTPVFGTSCPPRGMSGRIRQHAYRRYSEGRATHWLLLLAADRVDTVGSTLRSFASRHPDNPLTETGILAELKHHGLRSRLGQKRADVVHQPFDLVIVAWPWIAATVLTYRIVRLSRGHRTSARSQARR